MKQLDFSNWQKDLLSGVVVSVIALPLAIAFGVTAFSPLGPEFVPLGAIAGMTGAIFTGFFASFLGGCPPQVTGPTGPMSVVARMTIATVIASPVILHLPEDQRMGAAIFVFGLTVVLGGLVEIILGLIRAGKLIKFIPYSVLAGFMNGISVIIILSQIRPLLGFTSEANWTSLFTSFGPQNLIILGVGLVTALVMVLMPKITKKVPASLAGLAVGIGVYFAAGAFLDPRLLSLTGNTLIIGPIPGTIPSPAILLDAQKFLGFLTPELWQLVIQQAIVLGLLGAIDTLLTSVLADFKTRGRHDSNKELIGQGIGNMISGIFGGLPGAGATVRTMVNIDSGGRSGLSGMTHSLVLLMILVTLGTFAQWIPMTVLAGILIITGIKMVDLWSLSLIRKKSVLEDIIVMLVVTVITVTVDLIIAVGVGLAIASVLFIRNQIQGRIVRSLRYGDTFRSHKLRTDEQDKILSTHGRELLLVELEGSLFFGTIDRLSQTLDKETQTVKDLILDFRYVKTMDLTGGQMLLDLVRRLKSSGDRVCFSGLEKPTPYKGLLQELQILQEAGEKNIFPDMDWALESCEDGLLTRYGLTPNEELPPMPLAELQGLKALGNADLKLIESLLVRRDILAGEVIYRVGDPANEMFFILGGEVSVYHTTNDSLGKKRLVTFGRGSHFGEISFIGGELRHTTVTVSREGTLVVLTSQAFQKLQETSPRAALVLVQNFAFKLSMRLKTTKAELVAIEQE